MTDKADEHRIEKLVDAARALREGRETRFPVTRLTSLKSLCRDPRVARRFALYLAKLTQDKMDAFCPEHIGKEDWAAHKTLVARAVAGMQDNLDASRDECRSALGGILSQIAGVQSEHRKVGWNSVRRIVSRDMLVVEYAMNCFVCLPADVSYWAYQTGRHYAEQYDPRYGDGLLPASAPLLEDIVQFWEKGAFPGKGGMSGETAYEQA